jgi:hypothetical protein
VKATSPDKLIILDYSGTLSLEAPLFARPESLLCTLAESGLAAFGVTSPEIFWERIVNPTWIEGSTTQAGYKHVMAERIAALRLTPGASADEIAAAASCFVERYLDHSRIDPHWRPLLMRLSENQNVGVIIATDHYAEATGKIIDELGAWGIPAAKIGTATHCSPENGLNAPCSPAPAAAWGSTPSRSSLNRAADTPAPQKNAIRSAQPCHRPFLIANSADIGSWKAEIGFWKALKAQVSPDTVKQLLLIDDFGFNEAVGDGYSGASAKIAGRRAKTRATLRKVIPVEAEIVSFFLEGEKRYREEDRARLIAETALRIDRFLEQ